jgi:4-amino-4-deoxy-L-arabinose transferase-like glycosyltransferase
MTRPEASRRLVPPSDWLNTVVASEPSLGAGFLVMVTLLAAVLRFFRLGGQSLWVDEVMSWQTIRPGVDLAFVEQITDAIQGPLYLALTWPLLRIADTEIMLRLVPALAGVLAVPLFALTVQRLFNARSARLAALLLAISPFHVWYSQEGRGYALLLLCTILMGYLFLRLFEDRPGFGVSAGLALAMAAGVWSNMSAIFLMVALGLTVLFWQAPRTGRQWGVWSLAFVGAGFLVLPWVLKASGIWAVDRLVVTAATGESLRGETTFTPLALPYSLYTFFYGFSLGPSLRELHAPDKWPVLRQFLPVLLVAAVPVGVSLVSGLLALRRRQGFLLLWILIPLAILIFLAVRNVKPWNPRYVAVVLPWLLTLSAAGLVRLPRRTGAGFTLLLMGLMLFSLWGHFSDGRYAKADIRGMVEFISARETSEGDPVPDAVLVPSVGNVFKYYYRGPADILNDFGWPQLRSAQDAEAFCDSTLSGRDALLWVVARSWYFDPQDHLPGALARRGHLRLIHETPGALLYSWQRPVFREVHHGE